MKDQITLDRKDAEELIEILSSVGDILGDTEDMKQLLIDKLQGRIE